MLLDLLGDYMFQLPEPAGKETTTYSGVVLRVGTSAKKKKPPKIVSSVVKGKTST